MNQENLPIEIKNNQLAVNKRINKRKIEGIKKVGRIALNLGITGASIVIGTGVGVGTIGTIAAIGIAYKTCRNATFEIVYKKISKDSMFLLRKNRKGEIEITQDLGDPSIFKKLKGCNEVEKGAIMGTELLVHLQNIKQKYQDEEIESESSKDGNNNVYPQIYTTTTHGINIKTLEALEQLGYVQIERKEQSKKSNLFLEKLMFREGLKKDKVQMYNIALKVTDKTLDVEEIYKTYNELKNDKGKNPIRKPIKRIGIILEALKNKNIDIEKNDIGELIINYKAQESFAERMKKEQKDSCKMFRENNYIGDTTSESQIKHGEEKETVKQHVVEDIEIEH